MTTRCLRAALGLVSCALYGLCSLAAVGLLAPPAQAALGDDVSAIEHDSVHMHAALQIRHKSNYDIHELATPAGSVVREFVGPNSKVFAVSWSGGWRPNLRDIMGTHYDRYIEGMRGRRRARGPVRIELPGMVVFMGGYLRTFWGHVYLTNQLPAGFSPQELSKAMRMLVIAAAGALLCNCSSNPSPSSQHATGGSGGSTQSGQGTGGSHQGTAGTGGNDRATGGAGGASAGGAGGSSQASGGAGGSSRASGGAGGSSATGGAGGTSTGGTAVGGAGGGTGGMAGSGGASTGGGAGGARSGGAGGNTQSVGGAAGNPSTTDPNVAELTIDSGPSDIGYLNGGFVSVTICEPGTNNCQTIDHILVDTGSIGLRVLESEVTLKLAAATGSAGKTLAECSPFVSGTSWGPVRLADVKLGGETAKNLRIQLVGEATYTLPSDCAGTPINDLQTLGSKGIVGVGIYVEDCGTACARQTGNPGVYYECTSARTGGCSSAVVQLADQITNPIAGFATDNNGSFIQLPSIPASGAPSVSGVLVFGIGTQSNNGLGSAKVIPLDSAGMATTSYPAGGTKYRSFIDSGSNGLYFLNSSVTKLAACSGGMSNFYCPQTTADLNASMLGKDGSAVSVAFSVANASKFSAANSAFSNLGGQMPGYPTNPSIPPFDWGLPFYFGRTVFTALESHDTPAGSGPYFAF